MTKQTAVEWFSIEVFNQIELMKSNYISNEEFRNGLLKKRDKALAMEKEQIVDAYKTGDGDPYFLEHIDKYAERYYEKTFRGVDD